MKKTAILIAFILAPIVTNAQSFFDTLEDMDGVDMVVVNKDAFELLSKFSPEKLEASKEMNVFNMINDLNEFRMFSTDDISVAKKLEAMTNTVIEEKKLTQLMRIKEDDSRIKIYVKTTENKDYVSEVLMFIKGLDKRTKGISESMIVSLTGNIDVNKMSDLADAFRKEDKKK
ncbi:DUF4252 domain-containing protein [uncultured Polaribacter sp.]|uniref:DUF4252 domain-containing protein n=1 Tax=uncultured Polaribacter sp. TaxID=174711 RepID=UPI00261383C5|nr:DUF4252 domain-containing protein [uncultured Polaribacter sp.]